jgi:hypothetical protein
VRVGFIHIVGLLVVLSGWLLSTSAGHEVIELWIEGANVVVADDVVEAAPDQRPQPSAEQTLAPDAMRVLFVGNSHTFFNNMPAMIAALAQTAGKRPLYAKLITQGGATLREHAAAGVVNRVLSEGGWNALVLQEQQQYPALGREQREREMNAPARIMSMNAQAIGARTIVQMVWARRDGDFTNVAGDTFAAMHERSVTGHRELAHTLGAELAPSAIAWKRAMTARPELSLWHPDGSHPALAGSYLAACVLYKALYGANPTGLHFTAGLPERDAAFLQEVAATTHAE